MLRGISGVPVIVATARDDEAEIVRLLNAGADDYLVKPFSGEHLNARLAAVLRRARDARAAPPAPCTVGRAARRPGPARGRRWTARRSTLTRREFDLLAYLAARAGRVVSRRELLAEVWQQPTARTRRSTSTCRGCAASSARARRSPATCTRCAASASSWSAPADETPTLALARRRRDHVDGGAGLPRPARRSSSARSPGPGHRPRPNGRPPRCPGAGHHHRPGRLDAARWLSTGGRRAGSPSTCPAAARRHLTAARRPLRRGSPADAGRRRGRRPAADLLLRRSCWPAAGPRSSRCTCRRET